MENKQRPFFGALAGTIALWVSCISTYAAGWEFGKVSDPQGAPLYKQGIASGTPLGRYPLGTKIRVYTPAQNGYYTLYFSQLWQGVHYVWIPEASVQITPSAMPNRASSTPRTSSQALGSDSAVYKKNAVRAVGSLMLFSPSDLQGVLGDKGSTFSSFTFGLEFEHWFSKDFSIALQGMRYSISRPVVSAADPLVTYFANGFNFLAVPAYIFYRSKKFNASVGAGVGISFNTAGNTADGAALGGLTETVSSTVVAIPIVGEVTGNLMFSKSFGAFLRLGYQYESLGSVPVAALPLANSLIKTSVNLGGFFTSLGLSVYF